MPFAFSTFLYPLGHCSILRLFYSPKLLSLRTHWAYHVLQLEPDNLAPVYTPEESERRTMGKRTSWLHLLTFCPTAGILLLCKTESLALCYNDDAYDDLLTLCLLSYRSLHRLRLAALTLPHGSVLIPSRERLFPVSFVHLNYSKRTSQAVTLGRTSGKVVQYLSVND